MTTLDHTRPAAGHAAFGGLFSAFNGVLAAVTAWNDARMTRRALAKLSDRELDDIGLSRADIETIR